MNYNIIEGAYAHFDEIREDFIQDYIFSFDLSNGEIRAKYGLTWNEFKEFCEKVKSEFGLSRRPRSTGDGKFYYKTNTGFIIQKRVNGITIYFGHAPTEELAKKCVEICKKYRWDVDVCRDIIKSIKLAS